MSAVVVHGLFKSYGDVRAVAGLDLLAPTAAITAVLGPNGAGKTTTVEICEGLRSRDGGHVEVLGQDPATAGGRRILKDVVGVMPQTTGAPPGIRVGELVDTFAALHAHPLPVTELLGRLGIDDLRGRTVRRLSGGQAQRLSLALAVVGRPALVFLDEPSAGLDVQARLAVWDLVRDLRAAGVSVVLTTHLLEEAEVLADHVVVVDQGRAVAAGTVVELTGTEVQVRFRGPIDLDVAGLSAALPGLELTGAAGAYVLSGGVGPDQLATLTRWAAQRSITLVGLTVGPRTLEDVFLGLTGRELRS